MTIKRARELLGKRGERLTDQEVIKLVQMLQLVCSRIIDEVVAGVK